MSELFARSFINGMPLANRFVRSATWEGLATDHGAVTPRLIDTLIGLARGGVGLIICSHSYVSPEGQGTPWQIGVYRDELVDGLKELTSAVHDDGGRIVMQLAHAGAFAEVGLTGLPALAVSKGDGPADAGAIEISGREIARIIAAFAAAARRAREAGFDGVQIHAGHGYLLSQFLSPAFNRRRDEYGGAMENRARIHLAVCRAVRQEVGADFPLLIKMNCGDFIDNGLTAEDSMQAAQMFAAAGFDAIELSGGIIRTGKLSPSRPGIHSEDREAYYREYARELKKKITIPLILVGGMRSFTVAEKLVCDGIADYISMSRPFIREPELIKRWQAGDRRKAECVSDNLCFAPGFSGKGVYCVTRERGENKEEAESAYS
ncbi:MAG: NADH:flavin oxidoreductase [Proteobacteria bacterium]|nr:NADH:flavin oxidoreductase [Pseudomonadota bacterium]